MERVANDCLQIYVLPRSSISGMLETGVLSPSEHSYAYAAWKWVYVSAPQRAYALIDTIAALVLIISVAFPAALLPRPLAFWYDDQFPAPCQARQPANGA